MINNLEELMNFFNIDLVWLVVILISLIAYFLLKAYESSKTPKSTTVNVLGDIRGDNEICAKSAT